MVWNVVGEFVSLKNMTLGLNRPWFVMNAAFHSSPLMRTLLYPQHMSNLENSDAPWMHKMSSLIRGRGYRLRMVHSFNRLWSWTGCNHPSFFLMKKKGAV